MKEQSELKTELEQLRRRHVIGDRNFSLHAVEELMALAYNLDRNPTLPVEVKTAEEILRQHLHGYSNQQFEVEINRFPLSECIYAMEAYHAQYTQTPTDISTRFEIENSGRRLLKFETEAQIKDTENPDCTIIVQSGYTTLKETDEYADKIVKILNNGSI